MSGPTLIIPPLATPPATTDPMYTPSFTADEIDLLETVLTFYQQSYPNWNITPTEQAKFQSVLAKVQNLQLQPVYASKQLTSAQVATQSIVAEDTETIQILWGVPFADNTYVVTCSIQDDSGFLRVNSFSYLPNGTGLLVRVQNVDTAGAHQGSVNVLAFLPPS